MSVSDGKSDQDQQTAQARPGAAASRGGLADARIVVYCLALVGTMVGASYAAVPLYDLFCRVTGFGGTTQTAEAVPDKVLDQTISVRFDANVAAGLPWSFAPEAREVTLNIGQSGLMIYTARNDARVTNAGTASYNVTPPAAGKYFVKVECFCFTEQSLQAGEAMDMPVAFFVDPDIVNDPDLTGLPEITLSYTFFPDIKAEANTSASAEPLVDQAGDRLMRGEQG